ncbi:hypothetical protein QR90_13535 [Deinococcus radiopugnans]|uniref:Uncharacterized protein n=1 Tax=Deinococcus radiopugnans TaxID=57497 RepID=A0A0A7KII2_9DEIO|nr:hypothetical protein [Deinococcus radiopugnans]AIZ45875.1 hypothetical protein QR90_13535 [Deinococcus radiopugnans]
MPEERPFLTEARPQGEHNAAAAPPALFDLAVNRAWAALRGSPSSTAASAQASAFLAGWHARTRFARRVPLDAVRAALAQHPGGGEWHWAGGPTGGWTEGKAPFP